MKLINASRWGTALWGVLLGINLVGCGGGGDGGDDNNDNPEPVQAPGTIGGNRVHFYSGNAENRTITFREDNATWSEARETGNVEGSYQYQRVENGGSGELILSEGGDETRLVLSFNSATTGSYLYRDQAISGTFEMQTINPNPDPGGGGNEPPTNDGLAPSTLAGRTMYGTRTFTTTGPVGQTHVYTFALNTFHDSDPPEESDGEYVFQPSGDEATLTLNYQEPAGFSGDKHEMNMTFHTETAGVFESIYTRRDGTVIRINGTFTLE